MADHSVSQIEIERLHLDLDNPRFGLLSAKDEDEALTILVDRENVKELWGSISTRGFESYEPLIAIPHPTIDEHFVVIEGNRRLAACRSMLDPTRLGPRYRARVPQVTGWIRDSLAKLPVAIVNTRADASSYIGFKHVNGPATWSSLAKAKFGVEMLESRDIVANKRERMKRLTLELGDSRGMLLRVFVAYKIFLQAIHLGILGDEDGSLSKEIDFSHLYTMLNNPETREFLGIGRDALNEDDVIDSPVPPDKVPNLEQLFEWLFGDNKVIMRQGEDRPKLQKVLASSEGLEALRSSGDLNYAYVAAGLQKDDWLKELYTCAALAKSVENNALEMTAILEAKDRQVAQKQAMLAHANLSALVRKLTEDVTGE